MKEFLISPPFGNFLSHPKCSSVMGTYTLERRGGWPMKLYRAALTVRPIEGGWVNNIGLQNPGIKSVKKFNPEKIYSIAAIQPEDWDGLIEYIPKETMLELNVSCPNVLEKHDISDEQITAYLNKFPTVIFKLSPTDGIGRQIDRLVDLGATYIHIANAMPTARGGESGARLKEFSLKHIKATREKYPDLKIVGGGGIYSTQDIELYKAAGADHFSLASIWFTPWKATHLLKKFK